MPERILTGDRPTGPLHLGHYVGSLQERLACQRAGVECFIIIADYQVMTDRLTTDRVEQNILEVALDYLAVGIDPAKSTIFVQSRVPQLAELFSFLSMVTPMTKVARNPTVKEEVRAAGLESKMSLGMFAYPVSQAADILLFQPDYVPVGEDQKPHIELTREIARTFNELYGETFKLPEVRVSQIPRLLGTDASQKMSKSRDNAIFLADEPTVIQKKIRSAVTDSEKEIRFDVEAKPAISNLLMMYQIATGLEISVIEQRFAGKGYGDLKRELADALISFLEPMRKQREIYADNRHYVAQSLMSGTERAITEGEKTMREVRKAVKYEFPRIFYK